jgi:hypothetical protein
MKLQNRPHGFMTAKSSELLDFGMDIKSTKLWAIIINKIAKKLSRNRFEISLVKKCLQILPVNKPSPSI